MISIIKDKIISSDSKAEKSTVKIFEILAALVVDYLRRSIFLLLVALLGTY